MAANWLSSFYDIPALADTNWHDLDLSAVIPEGATGVIIRMINTSASTASVQFRNNGSTDSHNFSTYASTHYMVYVGVDASRILEYKCANTSFQGSPRVEGYFGSEATFFTNKINMSCSYGAFADIDVSADVPSGAIAAFCWAYEGNAGYDTGWRPNGSSDNYIASQMSPWYFIAKLDANRVFEFYAETVIGFGGQWLLGYLTEGWTFLDNFSDYSGSGTTTWYDLAALPAGAKGGVFECGYGSLPIMGLRLNGSSDDNYRRVYYHSNLCIECDGSRIIEGKRSGTGYKFYLTGYSTADPVLDTGDIKKIASVALASVKKVSGVAIASIKKVAGEVN